MAHRRRLALTGAWRRDALAAALTVAVTLGAGVPVGLLWAGLSPRVTVVITGSDVDVVDVDAFIAADTSFLAAVLVAGAVGGLLAWRLGSAHGPAVVLALTLGGLAAARLAVVVGGQVDGTSVQDLLDAGVQGRRELGLRLRATSALLGWPIASLLTYLGLTLRQGRPDRPDLSWG